MTGRSLTFHVGMSSLLSDLREEMPQPSAEEVFAFVYKAIAEEARDLRANSGCQPTSTGTVEQKMFTTDRDEVVEVRLEVKDRVGGRRTQRDSGVQAVGLVPVSPFR